MTQRKRGIILFWPLWLAPVVAVLVVNISGPTYSDAPNQDAMVVRFLALVIWSFIVLIGTVITLLAINQKKGIDYISSGCAAIASLFVFLAISSSMK